MKHYNDNLVKYLTAIFGIIVIIAIIASCKTDYSTIITDQYSANSLARWESERDSIYKINAKFAEQNPHGFTDIPRTIEKPEGVYRIAVLGDSWVWGDGISYKKVWSHLLEDKICSKYDHIEVMSWGKCGWTTHDEYDFYRQEGYAYDIDLLIIGFVENDPHMGADAQPSQSQDWLDNLYTSKNLMAYKELLKKLSACKSQHQTEIIFVISPLCINKKTTSWKEKILYLLQETGLKYVDLYNDYQKQYIDIPCETLFINPFNGHPGEELNRFIANHVFKYLKRNKHLKQKRINK